MSRIFNLFDIPSDCLEAVGGKARGLNKLHNFGFNVPEAFVITEIEEDEDFSEALSRFRESGWGCVSVRSSATLEDGEQFSAAGQFSTALNVSDDGDFIRACRECMDSIRNVTAAKYAETFLKNAGDCRMNIVVQKMIGSVCSGVIFSRAPMRPGFSLVEAVTGLCENLVSGKMSAQQYRVREGMVESMPEGSILTRERALELGDEGRRAERMFGFPVDLEWAVDADGVIHWLQARPITITESVTVNELDCTLESGSFVYTTGNIGEMMPGAVTPLCLSTNMYALDWGVRQAYLETGCIPADTPPFAFIAPFYNHMFFNMTHMYTVCHSIIGSDKASMDTSICGHVLEGFPDIDMPDKPLLQRLRNTALFMRFVMKWKPALKGMDKVVGSLEFKMDTDMHDLYAQIVRNFEYLKKAQYYHYLASYYSGGQTNILNMTVGKDFKDKNAIQASLAGCLTQVDDIESAGILKMMQEMAAAILSEHPEASSWTDDELSSFLYDGNGGKVQTLLAEFMKKHGHRGIREPEIMSLPWRDNRESFVSSLKCVISSVGSEDDHTVKPWAEYAEDILSNYKGLKRKFVLSCILKARKGICCREYTKARTILVLDRFKQAYRRLASMMTEAGLLPDEESIFFLQQDEVGDLLNGNRSLIKKAIARRRLFPHLQNMKFPYCQMGVPQPVPVSRETSDESVLTGTPVSRGMAVGKARVVRTEKDAAKLKKGEIMIAECTDIGWSPYYSIVSGMITEIGSALSHGVVVAREYALPTVVNVEGAMDRIKTGDSISIDGNTGTVIIRSRE